MAIVTTNNQYYSDIATAIRGKGVSGSFIPAEMAEAIGNISTGISPIGLVNITANGTYDVTDKASAIVNVISPDCPSASEQLNLVFAKSIDITSDITSGNILLGTDTSLPTLASGDIYGCAIFNIVPILSENAETLQYYHNRWTENNSQSSIIRWTGSGTGSNSAPPSNAGITIDSSGNVYLHVWSTNFAYRSGNKLLCLVWRYS